MPVPLIVSPGEKVQVPGGRVVGADGICQIAQVNRRTSGRRVYDDVAYLLFAFELTRRIDRQVLAFDLELTSRHRDVSRPENILQRVALRAVRRKALLRVLEEDLFAQNSGASDFGHDRDRLDRLF